MEAPTYGSVQKVCTDVKSFEHAGNSAMLTAGIIVADVVGAGILSMATAVAQIGWLWGAGLIVVLLFMNVHISLLLWRVFMCWPQARSLTELTSLVFDSAGERTRDNIVMITGAAQYTFISALLGLYVLTIGKSVGMVLYDTQLCLPTLCLCTCAAIYGVHASGRTMGSWQWLIWANCLTILGTICIPLLFMAIQGVEESRGAAEYAPVAQSFDVQTLSLSCSTFAFAFTGQFILVEIMSEMQDPSEFPKAYTAISAPFQAFAFLAVGVGGYYFLGSAANGIIVDALPFGICFRVAALLLGFHMLVTYVIKGVVVSKALDESYAERYGRDYRAWFYICAALLAVAFLVSQIVPFFNDLVDLLGASLTPFCCWVMPIVLYLRSINDSQCTGVYRTLIRPGPIERVVLLAELVFALVLTVVGTYSSVSTIWGHWNTYGPPFSCHCQGMWNTCDCSALHPGMDHCIAKMADGIAMVAVPPHWRWWGPLDAILSS